MRILHAYKVYRPEVEGGIPEVISTLTDGEPDGGRESSIFVARLRGPPRTYQMNGVLVRAAGSLGTLLSMPIAPTYPASFLLHSARADVVVHHAPFPLTDLAIAAMSAKPVLIVHWHADIIGRAGFRAVFSPFIRHSLRRADKIVVSHPEMIARSENLRRFSEKCVAIPYGADIEFWGRMSTSEQFEAEKIRQHFPRLFVAVGRLVPYKGYSVLLRALKGVDAQLIVVGDGPLLGELQKLAGELGVAARVRFAGRLSRSEIKQYVNAACALVLSSVSPAEAFGLVQIEAMAAGRAVINTDLPTAVPSIARHEQEGLTVAPNDAESLRVAMSRLLDDRALAERLGQAGRRRAFGEFSRQTFRERNFALYEEAVSQRLDRSKRRS